MVAVVLITSIFTYYQEARSSAIMESFKKMVPQSAHVLRDGKISVVECRELVPGDIVEVAKGDRVPADILILQGGSFKVDESSLTGESKAVRKCPDVGSTIPKDPREAKNLAFFSTNVQEGKCRALVIRTGDATVVGGIAGLATSTDSRDTPIRKELNHFIKIISGVAIFLGITFGIVALCIGYDWLEAILFLIGIIVANVPEGLLATVTVALTLTAKKMARKNCLVKNIEAVETLGSTSLICTDKTGTLTQNRMTVTDVWCNSLLIPINTDPNLYGKDFPSDTPNWRYLARCAGLCSNARFTSLNEIAPVLYRDIDGDATESGILKMFEAVEGNVEALRSSYPRVAEIPFDSGLKYHVSIHKSQHGGPLLMMKGAPERVLEHCTEYLKDGTKQTIDENFKLLFQATYEHLGGQGKRVLGFCQRKMTEQEYPDGFKFDCEQPNFSIRGNCFLGLVALVDPPKASVPDAVASCRSAGIKVIMVTGDHPLTAEAIARQVGIISGQAEAQHGPEKLVDDTVAGAIVITGSELANLTRDGDKRLEEILAAYPEIVFARTTPEQKLDIVRCNQNLGSIVAVTGDGVNDSPALKKADIGIAMGIVGSDVSKAAADMILMDDNFASIVSGVEEGRLIFDNLKKSIAYTLTSNIPEIAPFLAFICLGIPLALGTITILFIDLGTDMIPAISLAYEEPERDIMSRKPRDPKHDRLVNTRLIFLTYCVIGVIQASAGFFIYLVIMAEHGFKPGMLLGIRGLWDNHDAVVTDSYGGTWSYAERKALEYTCHTGFFLAIVQVQWADLIISKTRKVSVFEQGLLSNYFMNFALLFETVLAAVLIYVPGTDRVLRLYQLPAVYWLPALPYAVLIFGLDEIRRLLIRKYPDGWIASETYY